MSESKKKNISLSVDSIYPTSTNLSIAKGKKLDVETLYNNSLSIMKNDDPHINFSSDQLVERKKQIREAKLNYYRHMLKYCYKRIEDIDNEDGTDMVFTVMEKISECRGYDSRECIEYISTKLREQHFDTTVLTDTTMFITWKYLELKKENHKTNIENKK